MTTLDSLVTEVRAALRGYGLFREQVTFLSGAITDADVTATVDDGTAIAPGVVEIDGECIYVQSIAANVLTITPDGRGWDGTTAAAHAAGSRVVLDPAYPTWRLTRAINDTIVGTAPDLFGVGTTSFTFNPSVTTYSMPADCEGILQVTADTIGPSGQQEEIHEYRFDSAAPVAEFATGNCLTLLRAPFPGRTVTVSYRKNPSEITTGQAFTASGLAESARSCVLFGALGRLLSTIDASRVMTDTASAVGYADLQRVGTATTLAAQLTARYQMELNSEQRRLRQAYPARVTWRGR